MKTRYQVGQKVWYVECFAYATGPSKSVCYYRPFRGVISGIKIERHLYYRQRPHVHNSVKYHVNFDTKERNKGYQQQNENIFANKKNALEWARLMNELSNSRKVFDTEKERQLTVERILRQMKKHRRNEPIEENVYL